MKRTARAAGDIPARFPERPFPTSTRLLDLFPAKPVPLSNFHLELGRVTPRQVHRYSRDLPDGRHPPPLRAARTGSKCVRAFPPPSLRAPAYRSLHRAMETQRSRRVDTIGQALPRIYSP